MFSFSLLCPASSDVRPFKKSSRHTRSLWHITPLIVEEYIKGRAHQDEEPTTNPDLLLPSPIPKGTPPKSEEEASRPQRPRAQIPTSRKSLGVTVSPVSDKRSPDSPLPWISSPQTDDSPRSSLYSAFRGALDRVSPSSSKRHLQDRTIQRLSDDSAHASLSETNSQTGGVGLGMSQKGGRLQTPNLDTHALNTSGPESEGGEQHATDTRSPQLSEGLPTAKPPDSAIPSAGTATKSSDPTAGAPPLKRPPPGRRRVSLPLPDYRLSVEVEKRRQLVDDEREQYEYEIRAQYVTCSFPPAVHLFSSSSDSLTRL